MDDFVKQKIYQIPQKWGNAKVMCQVKFHKNKMHFNYFLLLSSLFKANMNSIFSLYEQDILLQLDGILKIEIHQNWTGNWKHCELYDVAYIKFYKHFELT